MASIRSFVWNAWASNAARMMWAAFVSRDSPIMAALALGFQYGAPRPVKAGMKVTPALSLMEVAIFSVSAAFVMMPRLSRSHCIAAPAMKIDPSRA